ncbi:MAG: pantetheine-phosphate adenylyltransferase [Deltaproteobacteria bacterium]|nr:pantetheine-phosphate adenylyltransferase [Deltaproteobacteria bacterium]
MAQVAIYPGSFDPITSGHLGIIERGLYVFDKLIVAVAINARKGPFFTLEERLGFIERSFEGNDRVVVDSFTGLTVDYVRTKGANVILRGLRAVADFEYELQMANLNRKLAPGIETLLMMTGEEYFFVSSQNVKEIALLGGDIQGLVPPHVVEAFREKLERGEP